MPGAIRISILEGVADCSAKICCRSAKIMIVFLMLLLVQSANAHEVNFSSTMTYSLVQPAGSAESIANWTGAGFDAENIGGSGVNSDGGSDNGTANDAYTYVANNQSAQGQSFITGDASYGYELHSITVQMAGYSNNAATGANCVYWDLGLSNGPVILTICRIDEH